MIDDDQYLMLFKVSNEFQLSTVSIILLETVKANTNIYQHFACGGY